MSTVFVSGANGYIAQHLIVQLIEKGYNVIGSVRSKEKGDKLVANLPEKFQYVIVPDLTKPDAFFEVLKDHPEIVCFFHNASPVSFSHDDFENDTILPAITGTKNVLKAVKQHAPQIKKLIYTSSFAAVGYSSATKADILTESTWNDIGRHSATNGTMAYRVSKTFAEKAVWDFVKTEKPNFSFNTINPTFVFGPQAFDSEVKGNLNFSAEVVNELLKLKPDDPIPGKVAGFIDVRDVAKAHIYAYESELSSTRFLLYEERYTSQSVLDLIHKNFKQLSHLPIGEPGTAEAIIADLPIIDNSKTRALIGPFISLEQSVVDTVQQVIDNNDTL